MNLLDAVSIYAGTVQAKAAYYAGKKIWSLPNWLPPGILTNILGFYRLNDNGSGGLSLLDSSGNNNTLTNINGVQLGSGITNGGASFSSGKYLRALSVNSFAPSSEFTISAWVNVSSLKSNFCLAGGHSVGFASGTIAIYGDSTGTLHLNNGVGVDVQIPNFFELNTWTHCAFLRRFDNNFWIYKNGTLLTIKASLLSGNSYNSTELYFGSFPGRSSEDYQFLGNMDAIGIWSNWLGQEKIIQLYNAGAGLEL